MSSLNVKKFFPNTHRNISNAGSIESDIQHSTTPKPLLLFLVIYFLKSFSLSKHSHHFLAICSASSCFTLAPLGALTQLYAGTAPEAAPEHNEKVRVTPRKTNYSFKNFFLSAFFSLQFLVPWGRIGNHTRASNDPENALQL